MYRRCSYVLELWSYMGFRTISGEVHNFMKWSGASRSAAFFEKQQCISNRGPLYSNSGRHFPREHCDQQSPHLLHLKRSNKTAYSVKISYFLHLVQDLSRCKLNYQHQRCYVRKYLPMKLQNTARRKLTSCVRGFPVTFLSRYCKVCLEETKSPMLP